MPTPAPSLSEPAVAALAPCGPLMAAGVGARGRRRDLWNPPARWPWCDRRRVLPPTVDGLPPTAPFPRPSPRPPDVAEAPELMEPADDGRGGAAAGGLAALARADGLLPRRRRGGWFPLPEPPNPPLAARRLAACSRCTCCMMRWYWASNVDESLGACAGGSATAPPAVAEASAATPCGAPAVFGVAAAAAPAPRNRRC